MHLLYVDDSGSVTDPASRFFVLAGFSIFERQTHWLEKQANLIAARFNASDPRSVELHGSPMLGGRSEWRSVNRSERHEAMSDALRILATHPTVNLFGVVVDRSACTEDPVALAFEHLCSTFDRLLVTCHRRGDHQRGLMVFDKHKSEEAVQNLARDFKEIGHRWGSLKNMSEVPVFLDSRASRLIQLADLVAFALKATLP